MTEAPVTAAATAVTAAGDAATAAGRVMNYFTSFSNSFILTVKTFTPTFLLLLLTFEVSGQPEYH